MNRRFISIGFLFSLLFLLIPGLCFSEELQAKTYVFASGGLGGGWYISAGGFATIISENEPKLSFKVIPGGGTANPAVVSENKADIGWGIAALDRMALDGNPAMFPQAYPNIRGMYGDWTLGYLHFIAAKREADNNSIQTLQNFADLIKAGRKFNVAISPVSTSDYVMIEETLKFYGISYKHIQAAGGKVIQAQYADQATQFKDRQVDFVFTNLAAGAAAVSEMAMSREMVLLPVSRECLDYMRKSVGTAKGDTSLPGGLYKGVDREVLTPAVSVEIICNKDLPDIVAYTIVKILAENVDKVRMVRSDYKDWNPEKSSVATVVPLHPGAERYFRERGWLK